MDDGWLMDELARAELEHAVLLAPKRFALGDRVRKKSGASWQGHVCGYYSTPKTPVGYAVMSEREQWSVQIYPEAALELVVSDDDPATSPAIMAR